MKVIPSQELAAIRITENTVVPKPGQILDFIDYYTEDSEIFNKFVSAITNTTVSENMISTGYKYTYYNPFTGHHIAMTVKRYQSQYVLHCRGVGVLEVYTR